MGNICRSPAAEGIMRSLVTEAGMQNDIYIDSAGTIDYHSGECVDSRMMRTALNRGYDLNTHRARMFNPESDFKNFDYILTMDNSNYSDIIRLDKSRKYLSKIFKITSFCKKYNEDEVPDPYFGGTLGFEYVIDLLEDACSNLLKRIKDESPDQK